MVDKKKIGIIISIGVCVFGIMLGTLLICKNALNEKVFWIAESIRWFKFNYPEIEHPENLVFVGTHPIAKGNDFVENKELVTKKYGLDAVAFGGIVYAENSMTIGTARKRLLQTKRNTMVER